VTLWVGSETGPGPANLYLRHAGERPAATPLLGAASPTRFKAHNGQLVGQGSWQDFEYALMLRLAAGAPAWFWHLWLKNRGARAALLDVIYAQDVALAPYWALRLNEHYVSQYLDHTPLPDPVHGWVVASRQNLPADGRNPSSLIGALRRGESFATDALQLQGLARRRDGTLAGIASGLPGRRLQHEHSLVAIQDAPLPLQPGEEAWTGFFGVLMADHPDATSPAHLVQLHEVMRLPESAPGAPLQVAAPAVSASLLETAAPLPVAELTATQLDTLFGARRHKERDGSGALLSFFHGEHSHVVLREKELQVLRPHGHILRSGTHLTPDETALTSTVWMSGVFHSMLTQGHVSFNRLLSTQHSYLDLFRSHGLRVLVELEGRWWLLHVPSAFEMAAARCRWIYSHGGGAWIEVSASALPDPREMTLTLAARGPSPPRWLFCLHLAVNGDDGCAPGAPRWSLEDEEIRVAPAQGSEMAARFPQGSFRLRLQGPPLQKAGGDELLHADGASRAEPWLCLLTPPAHDYGMTIRGELVTDPCKGEPPWSSAALQLQAGASLVPAISLQAQEGPLATEAGRLAELAPWLAHDALVHYLSPRGLEQYSGGGWGTRDVCQGPVELLLAMEWLAPLRDLLLRVMAAQNSDGDWPQWFMFFERDRAIRAGDAHGDIVLWPLVALAQYLTASGDVSILDERVPFFALPPAAAECVTVWGHVQRALALAARRTIPGTQLMAYGHGDWNDSLQPADLKLRERMCSSWTVTLHHQALVTLAAALSGLGRYPVETAQMQLQAGRIRSDFQRRLVVDGVLAGYALFEPGQEPAYLLHPRDTASGVRYSVLAMSHAILQDMLDPAQVASHLQLIRTQLEGPDGTRLFDRPLPYHGGPARIFQRAEQASYFGREIGLMYMHAHLRQAQALAHAGDADGFFRALCLANPIGIRERVAQAALRQSNCYYSSSDAAFDDRYQAAAEYARVTAGTVPLEGGWRVYSSGAGIALSVIRRVFLGLALTAEALQVDPVMPAALDGLRLETPLLGRPVEVIYRVGSRGCGVRKITLNGEALTFQEHPGVYRAGPALLPRPLLEDKLRRQANILTIALG
jgi:cellobiose phosphorylase